ncbi:MAG: hypothetical protein L3J34_04230, partial [Flavobacteriaceae bacterium]|nr:hypothetical protein [Flavobacteriaceae bacterium]
MDSALIFLKKAKNKNLDLKKRKEFLIKSYLFNKDQKNDSIKNSNLLKIALQTYNLKDTIFFKKVNREAQDLSDKIGDILGLAE